MPPRLSRRIEAFWYGRSIFAYLLLPLAWVYGLIIRTRRAAYRLGLLRSVRMPVPVIVVGNITVGGTGKTPVVAWVARELTRAGRRPGIVSRGYGGSLGERGGAVTAASDAAEAGDEPVLLARHTGCPVRVDHDRVAAARALVAEGVDVIVSDDGLQHYRLGRNLEIAVVDGERGLGNRFMLPAGPLRESPARLNETDVVLVNGGDHAFGGFAFRLVEQGARRLGGEERRELSSFASQRVRVVAGIGNPDRFVRELRASGIECDLIPVPDHGRISLEEAFAASSVPILMTEKDAIKYRDGASGEIWYVPVTVEFAPDGREALSAALRRAVRDMSVG